MLVMRAVLALAHVMYAHHTHIPNVNLNKRMSTKKKIEQNLKDFLLYYQFLSINIRYFTFLVISMSE